MKRDILIGIMIALVLGFAALGVAEALNEKASYEPIVLQSDPCTDGCLAPAPLAPPGHPSYAGETVLPRTGR